MQIALTNRRPLPKCTWSAVQEGVSREAYRTLKNSGSTALDEYAAIFDTEAKAKDQRLADAENEIQRLKSEIRKYESRSTTGSGLTLNMGQEQDLYDGEINEIVYDVLSDAASRVKMDSRRHHILKSLCASNASTNNLSSKHEAVKSLLRGYSSMDARIKKGLSNLGFEISEDGKHFKLKFCGDDRYTYALPKSGSDHRGGLNASSDISRLFF